MARISPFAYSVTGTVFLNTIHGQGLFALGNDVPIPSHLASRGYYELREKAFVASVVRGGDWFVDVGANIGLYTVLAASRVGRFGKVIAVEPNPELVELLRKSLLHNWLQERVEIIEAALGEKSGKATLRVDRQNTGSAHITDPNSRQAQVEPLERDYQALEVRMMTLDEIVPDEVPIRMLKIDVEGHEEAVIRGGQRCFTKRQFDHVMMEWVPQFRSSVVQMMECLSWILQNDYKLYGIKTTGGLEAIGDPARLRAWDRDYIVLSLD